MDASPAPRVLILEDDRLVARSFSLMLRKHRPTVVPSLAALREVLPTIAQDAVVLSDLGLDDCGAGDILSLLESDRPDLLARLFWLTGGGHKLDQYRGVIDRSTRPVVLKPLAPLDLLALVDGALAPADEG